MGAGGSKASDNCLENAGEEEGLENAGGQLYVSLKMEFSKINRDLIPHVYGSAPLVGSWDPDKAVSYRIPRPFLHSLFCL